MRSDSAWANPPDIGEKRKLADQKKRAVRAVQLRPRRAGILSDPRVPQGVFCFQPRGWGNHHQRADKVFGHCRHVTPVVAWERVIPTLDLAEQGRLRVRKKRKVPAQDTWPWSLLPRCELKREARGMSSCESGIDTPKASQIGRPLATTYPPPARIRDSRLLPPPAGEHLGGHIFGRSTGRAHGARLRHPRKTEVADLNVRVQRRGAVAGGI